METFFMFLDDIQKSGKINMFEATRVLRDMFDLDKQESFVIVEEWMKSKEKKVWLFSPKGWQWPSLFDSM